MGELDLKNEQVPVYEEILELYPKKKYFVNRLYDFFIRKMCFFYHQISQFIKK